MKLLRASAQRSDPPRASACGRDGCRTVPLLGRGGGCGAPLLGGGPEVMTRDTQSRRRSRAVDMVTAGRADLQGSHEE